MSIFSALNDKFQIVDFSPSHDQLLLRSMPNKDRNYNIDVILKGVKSFYISSIVNGFEISLCKNTEERELWKNKFNMVETTDYKIFSILTSDNEEFKINAMCFGVYHNKLEILESSIGRYDLESMGELILWYAD